MLQIWLGSIGYGINGCRKASLTLALALKQGNLSIPLAGHGLFPILLLALISYSGLPSIPGRDIQHRTVRLSVSCLERERLVE